MDGGPGHVSGEIDAPGEFLGGVIVPGVISPINFRPRAGEIFDREGEAVEVVIECGLGHRFRENGIIGAPARIIKKRAYLLDGDVPVIVAGGFGAEFALGLVGREVDGDAADGAIAAERLEKRSGDDDFGYTVERPGIALIKLDLVAKPGLESGHRGE